METLHLIVDLEKCIGCFNCLMACKDEHVGNSWLPYTDEQQRHDEKWINPEKHENGAVPYTEVCYVTKMCQHCGNAACEKAQPEAVERRPDGIVLLDAKKAKGNRALVDSCPYGMIDWNEELETAQKCTMSAHLIDTGWREPRCVQACPLRALTSVWCTDEEFQEMAQRQYLEPLYSWASKPRVLYKNLYKYNCLFLAGSLSYLEGDVEKAAAGAKVRLSLNGELLKEVESNFLGEFKFHRIPPESGTFQLEISLEGFRPRTVDVPVGKQSVCLENLVLERG